MKTFKHENKIVLSAVAYAVLFTVSVSASQVLPADFSRYDLILKRMPFGSIEVPVVTPPSPAAVTQQTQPAADSWIKNYRIIAITESSQGVRVGLANIKNDPVLSFFLFAGETDDDVTLVEADYDAEKALLKRGEEQYWLSMTGVTESGGSAAQPGQRQDLTDVQKLIANRVRQTRIPMRTPWAGWTKEEYQKRMKAGEFPPPTPPGSPVSGSTATDAVRLTREEKENALRHYNMDLIRAGGEHGVPLPIQLTPDEDAQLVAEGVLPPQ